MTIPNYTTGYPPDGSSLGSTKLTIRKNLDSTFQSFSIDHLNQNGTTQPISGTSKTGFHTIVHQVTQTSVNTINGINQVFAGVPGTLRVNSVTTPNIPSNGDTQLYSLTGAGGLSQLTGYSAVTNGFAWCGGILFQWFKVDSPVSGTTYNFPVAFPNKCFNVNLTPNVNDNSTVRCYVASSSVTTSGFTLQSTNTAHFTSMYVLAIGN